MRENTLIVLIKIIEFNPSNQVELKPQILNIIKNIPLD